MRAPPPGNDLHLQIRAGFVRKGTTLTRWCKENDLRLSNVRDAIIGGWDGPKGRAIRTKVAKAAGVQVSA